MPVTVRCIRSRYRLTDTRSRSILRDAAGFVVDGGGFPDPGEAQNHADYLNRWRIDPIPERFITVPGSTRRYH